MRFTHYNTKHYLLTILLLIVAFNSADSYAFGLFLQDIKIEFGLTDTQLGFLSSITSALIYAVIAIPTARCADRGNRVRIIGLMTAMQCLAVALLCLAGSFLHLFLLRILASVGDAGCGPAAYSLIADHFNRAERPRAVSRYMVGGPLAVVIGLFVGGWLNTLYGWRETFLLLSLPGLALAALAWITLGEPRRGKSTLHVVNQGAALSGSRSETVRATSAQPSLKEVCVTLWANVTFRRLLLCFSAIGFVGNAIGSWMPAFFIRSHGLETQTLGMRLAVIWGSGMFIGLYLGGELASRYAARNERLQLHAMTAIFVSLSITAPFAFLSPNHYLAFGLILIFTTVFQAVFGPLYAMVQTLVPERMRAMSIAIVGLFSSLIGGIGPLVTGALSEGFRPLLGEESLRFALVAVCPGFAWVGWCLWQASKTVARDFDAPESMSAQKGSLTANWRNGKCDLATPEDVR